MKTKAEKKIIKIAGNKSITVTIDPALNKYQGQVLFPEKLALAEEKLKTIKLPLIKEMAK